MADSGPISRAETGSGGTADTTAILIARARQGDAEARNLLFGRYIAPLRRWAHGRLPGSARDLGDTDDLVQSTLRRALVHLEGFEPRGEGAFLGYLRTILWHRIADEVRRVRRMPERVPLPDDLAAVAASPLDVVVAWEDLERYEAALSKLAERQREAVILRLEFGLTFPEIAEALGQPSANAARMFVNRAVQRLAEEMK